MTLVLRIALVVLAIHLCIAPVSSRTHRSKREIYVDFIGKHIAFVKEGRKPTYELLKGRLPSFANTPSRKKHSFILILLKKSDNEFEKRKSFIKELDTLVSMKIRNGGCKANRKGETRQEKLKVKPNTCKNTISEEVNNRTQYSIKLADYFICPIQMNELKTKTYLAEFNVQDKSDVCQYSERGEIRLGAGKRKNINTATQRQTTEWFLVNHLDGSQITDAKMCLEKKLN